MPRPTPSDRRYQDQKRLRSTIESGALKRACPTCGAAMGQGCRATRGRAGAACEKRQALADRARGVG